MPIESRAIAVALAGICTFLDLYATQALLPQLAQDFAATPFAVSLTVSATTFAVALIAPFIGAVADVYGRKRLIVAAMFALVLPTIAVAFAASLREMVIWRFVQGLLLPPIFAVTVAYIGEEWPASEATAVTGLYVGASSLGGFLSRFLTGLIAGHFGWRAAFLALAVLTVASAWGVWRLLPPERNFRRSSSFLASCRAMAAHLAQPALVATFFIGFGVLFSFVAVFTYIDFVLAAAPFHFTTAGLGAIFAVYLVGLVAAPLTGRMVAALGRRRLVVLMIALWIGGLCLTVLGTLGAIIIGLALCAACGMVCQSCSTSFVALSAREARSSAVGLYVTFYYVGGSAGALLGGVAWNVAGWPGCIALVTLVLAGIAATVLRFWPQPA